MRTRGMEFWARWEERAISRRTARTVAASCAAAGAITLLTELMTSNVTVLLSGVVMSSVIGAKRSGSNILASEAK